MLKVGSVNRPDKHLENPKQESTKNFNSHKLSKVAESAAHADVVPP